MKRFKNEKIKMVGKKLSQDEIITKLPLKSKTGFFVIGKSPDKDWGNFSFPMYETDKNLKVIKTLGDVPNKKEGINWAVSNKLVDSVKEEIAGNNTTSVPGAGEDSETVVMRRTGDKKNKRKENVKILKRFMDNWQNKQKNG